MLGVGDRTDVPVVVVVTVGGHVGGTGGQLVVVANVLVIVGGVRVDRKVGNVGKGEMLDAGVTVGSEVSVTPGIVLVAIGGVNVTVGNNEDNRVDVIGGTEMV